MHILLNIAAASSLALAAPAVARMTTVGGGGVVQFVLATGGGATSIVRGDGVMFSFSFDPTDLVLVGSNADVAGYRFTARNLTARIGDYQFQPLNSFGVLNFSRGFSSFGGPSSERVLNQTFAFSGSADGAPFTFPTGTARTSLAFTSTFRYGDALPPIDPGALTDPLLAARSNVSFAGIPVSGAARASVAGPGGGSFFVASVPETATWAMMIIGFGTIGGALRHRKQGGRAALA